jgi:hypothetical protein
MEILIKVLINVHLLVNELCEYQNVRYNDKNYRVVLCCVVLCCVVLCCVVCDELLRLANTGDFFLLYSAFLSAFAKLRKATVSFVLSARICPPAWTSAPNGRIFMKFDI